MGNLKRHIKQKSAKQKSGQRLEKEREMETIGLEKELVNPLPCGRNHKLKQASVPSITCHPQLPTLVEIPVVPSFQAPLMWRSSVKASCEPCLYTA